MTTIELVGDVKSKRRRPKHVPKPQPLSRDKLDGRLGAPKRYDAIVSGLTEELGGKLTPMQKELVDAFAGTAIRVSDFNARLLLGQHIDPLTYNTTVSNMMRLYERLGGKLTKDDGDEESALTNYLNNGEGDDQAA